MKQLFKVLLVVILLLETCKVKAQPREIGGIYYIFYSNDNQANVAAPWTSSPYNQKPYSGVITIPSTVEYNNKVYTVKVIDMDAFAYGNEVTAVSIPGTVTAIKQRAFKSKKLKSMYIPKSVTNIASGDAHGAFRGCLELRNMEVDPENTTYDSRDNCNAIIETKSNKLIWGGINTTIPASVARIGSYAFIDCEAASITIPEGLTEIGYAAFRSCKKLTSLRIPDSMVMLDRYSFKDCTSLDTVYLGAGLKTLDYTAFENCTNLKVVYCYAATPPTSTSGMSFNLTDVISLDTLRVYEASVSKYKSKYPWNKFKRIMAIGCKELVDGDVYAATSDVLFEQIRYKRIFDNTDWQPMYIPFSLDYSDWQADYEIARVSAIRQYDDNHDGTIDRSIMEITRLGSSDVVEANTPYLIRCRNVGETQLFKEKSLIYAAKENPSQLSSGTSTISITGTYKGVTASFMTTKGCYIMKSGSLVPASDVAEDLCPYRWYIQVANENGGSGKLGDVRIVESGEEAFQHGDVNCDGQVSISDVTYLVNIILERILDYDSKQGDVNEDGRISIADVTTLVNVLLGK